MKQVEIFKTNVREMAEAASIIRHLHAHFPNYRINFDLQDCDNVLRIETLNGDIDQKKIERLLTIRGYDCSHLL